MNIIRKFFPSSWIDNGQSNGGCGEPKANRGQGSNGADGGSVEGNDFPKSRLSSSSDSPSNSMSNRGISMRDIRPNTPQRLRLTEPNDNSYVYFQSIGRGGYSVVYEGATEQGVLPKAVKVAREAIKPERAKFAEQSMDGEKALFQTIRKQLASPSMADKLAPILSQFNLTPAQIIKKLVVISDVTVSSTYFPGKKVGAMPLVRDGRDLASALGDICQDYSDESRAEKIDKVLTATRDMLVVLSVLHKMGIMHRDIKPENVMTDTQGQGFLIDFGLALHAGSSTSRVGTAGYIAPEVQARKQRYNVRADLFSVGRLLACIFLGDECVKDSGNREDRFATQFVQNTAICDTITIHLGRPFVDMIRNKVYGQQSYRGAVVETSKPCLLQENSSLRPTALEMAILLDKECQERQLNKPLSASRYR